MTGLTQHVCPEKAPKIRLFEEHAAVEFECYMSLCLIAG